MAAVTQASLGFARLHTSAGAAASAASVKVIHL